MVLLWFVLGYWAVSVAIGLAASYKVKKTEDFVNAGRSLPFYMVLALVFATWFGSEAVLGIPAVFLDEGLGGIVADPFGAAFCLILAGLFFAKPLYRMKLLTIGDFYKRRYGRRVELLTTLAICVSYLGWVGAQIAALGLVFNVVSAGSISIVAGMWIGSLTVLAYTYFGGMWAVAVTDLLQMAIIVLGMLYIGYEVSDLVGGVQVVVDHASAAGKFANFWPSLDAVAILAFIAAAVTMMLGSIPQQDVFQRIQSAKSGNIAKWGAICGGSLYLLFAFIPIFLAYSAYLIDPDMVEKLKVQDSQLILPTLIMNYMPLAAQIIFFGALLSAIKSCASATLLAPSVMFTENILRPMLPKLADKALLKLMRTVTATFTVMVTFYAMYSNSSIFEMVEKAYQVTLVTAFIPLLAGVFWRGATKQGALVSILAGFVTWIGIMVLAPEGFFMPAQLGGLIASAIGMLVGTFMPQFMDHDQGVYDALHKGEYAYDQVVEKTS